METSKTTKAEGILWRLNTLGKEPSAPLASDPGSEPHHPTMDMLGGHGGR